ncbi:flagellar hook-basal body complex protein FliE [Rhizobacter sp. Root1221]|uniref:flagellar hook-basal body complex protein FliE n=1 Tax=Rhizobacter sp. Root1221 TaxID=1736433 RepID=UPI0006FAC4C0|nr:flagellar hook-basal body complex protein FliE [Rhizobacter sp. Root1221]KQV83060.1 flagellar hook-basal body protein [Rhizobacter sp. Root1221]
MDVTLKPFNFAQAAARAGLGVNGLPLANNNKAAGTAGVQGPDFQQALSQALRGVSDTYNQASDMQKQVQLGNPTVSLEETMVAMQKAQIGFQATMQVRNKLVSAYSEIMNMTV